MIAPVLAVLLLPVGSLSAQECGVSTGEPMVLRDQRIPFYEVVETFLLHAGIIYDTQGPDAYRAFLMDYGLNPDLESLRELHRAFDDLQRSLHLFVGEVEHETARRVGGTLAGVLGDIEENDPRGIDAVRDLRLRLGTQLRPQMSWIFLDGSPDFSVLDEAEDYFFDSLEGAGEGIYLPETRHDSGGSPDATGPTERSSSATRVKLSFVSGEEGPSLMPREETSPVHVAEVEWRSYSRADGGARVIGLFRSGTEPLGLVDITFQAGDRLRDELKAEGTDGFLRFVESFPVEASFHARSHTSLGCIAAQALAALACVACASPPDPVTCSACAAALLNMAAACNKPHCDQIQCNQICVQACHLYGWCSSTSGSSSPADCQCFGQRFDTPGCGGGPGCSTTVNEVSVLSLDGGDPVRLSTGPITLSRLEESEEMHHGEEVSYLMEEWAVLTQETPAAATDPAPPVRTLRSSSTGFAASQANRLRTSLAAASGASSATTDRVFIVVASPPHAANSREIPMPALKIASGGLRSGAVGRKIAIRADFSEAGDLEDLEILHSTLGGTSPRLAAFIEQALSLQHFSEQRHRVVAFAVLSVGESLEIDSDLVFLPQCCCGDMFCF